jgi:hypothetical protein
MDPAAPIETLAALADIEIPAPPPAAVPLPLLLGALALLLAAAIAFRIFRGRARRRMPPVPAPPADEALRRLEALQREWHEGKSNDRETAYRLCALLRIGLSLPGLDPSLPPAGIAGEREWSDCLRALRALRYGAQAGAIDPGVFAQARDWLTAHRAATMAPAHV